MIEIKQGDWVLVEHPYLYDSYVVRRVVSFTAKKFVGEKREESRADGIVWGEDNARDRSKIAGVFPGENAAISAQVSLRQLYEEKIAAERTARETFHKAAKALLNGHEVVGEP